MPKSRFLRLNTNIKLPRILVALIVTFSVSESSFAEDSPFRDDWIMKLEAQKLERQFMYRGSKLDKVAKVKVEYYKEEEPDKKTFYELMWFNDGKPIGMERKNKLEIPAGKPAKIQVKLKKDESTPEVEKAIADAIIRLSLDAFRKRFAIISIRVPQKSYDGIVDAMNKLNCVESDVEAEEANEALMNFSIESENKGPSTILYYY